MCLRSFACAASLLAALLSGCSAAPQPTEAAVFYPAPPDPPRVQFLRSISTIADVVPPRSGFDELLFGAKTVDGEIQRPFGCAVHAGVVYVTDSRFGQILTIDLEHRAMAVLELDGRAKAKKPTSVSFGEDGRMYFADAGRRQVVVLGPDHRYVGELGPWGNDSRPVDLEVSRDRLYVVDAGGKCVRVIDLVTGEQLQVLGTVETQDELLRGPTSVAVDEAGNCYVSDAIYSRIYVWDRDGRFVRHISQPGDLIGDLARPKGIAYLDHMLWVLDAAFENCQVFTLDGRALMYFGGPGTGPGNLYLPADIWVGKDGLELFRDRIDPDFEAERLIVVTSQFGPRKVSFYALGRSRHGQYPVVELPTSPPPAAVTPGPVDAAQKKNDAKAPAEHK